MNPIVSILLPEILLVIVACILFFIGCSGRIASRRFAPVLALVTLVVLLVYQLVRFEAPDQAESSLAIDSFARYIRSITALVAIPLLLLAWPSNENATGNSALNYGRDGGEFFGLFLLSIAGLYLVTSANDLIVLFLALELVSIPTYIMVSISRDKSVAQEAGVKYFFLGALSVALMIFGFSYLYGTTGQINFDQIRAVLRQGLGDTTAATLSAWQLLAVLMILAGFAFKMAAFPLHFYAGDVYEGAATPVTAFLAFVPKAAGFVATIKLLHMIGGVSGGTGFVLPPEIIRLLWFIAALTMTIGNVLGLLQNNIKRVLAYSSIAHTGYMLVGVASLAFSDRALEGVLFYLAAYGLMNAGAFGVLMLLPSRHANGKNGRAASSDIAAETYDDIAGQARKNIPLGLAMAISCFSLIGIPLTVGFIGKWLLIRPALHTGNTWLVWLVVILAINAAISAAYYLRIIATLFLRPEAAGAVAEEEGHETALSAAAAPALVNGSLLAQRPIALAVAISIIATLAFGAIPPASQILVKLAQSGKAIRISATR